MNAFIDYHILHNVERQISPRTDRGSKLIASGLTYYVNHNNRRTVTRDMHAISAEIAWGLICNPNEVTHTHIRSYANAVGRDAKTGSSVRWQQSRVCARRCVHVTSICIEWRRTNISDRRRSAAFATRFGPAGMWPRQVFLALRIFNIDGKWRHERRCHVASRTQRNQHLYKHVFWPRALNRTPEEYGGYNCTIVCIHK